MAADEALLWSAASTGRTTLRICSWSEPTLSLGYFQRHQDRESHPPSRDCAVVRRATGGGAILHDDEITYSLTAPVDDHADRQLQGWYGLLHAAWIRTLATCGIAAEVCPRTDPERERRFLCFERRAAGDLLLQASKIGGSAQRRHRRAVLQHGSLLLARSAAAPELPGIADLAGQAPSRAAWQDMWIEDLAGQLGVHWQLGGYTDAELQWVESARRDKFGHPKWTLRK
jgi:lipoate-protein ligase A